VLGDVTPAEPFHREPIFNALKMRSARNQDHRVSVAADPKPALLRLKNRLS
jgi:hypothetical protein